MSFFFSTFDNLLKTKNMGIFHFFKKYPKNDNLEWLGMDMHSHLLPSIDDGSPSVATSVSYIKQLNNLGLNKFICTPHIFKEIYPNNKESVTKALIATQKEIKNQKLNLHISAAAEYMMDIDFLEILKTEEILTLPNKYILIEMSYAAKNNNIEQYIFELNAKGYKPILAHPERYNYYHDDFNQYQRFKDMGCLLQLNALSVTGYYGKDVKNIALKLINQKIIDLVGTDLHHQKHLDVLKNFTRNGQFYTIFKSIELQNNNLFC
jgi:tyrosine-protein phosphatase YwqE